MIIDDVEEKDLIYTIEANGHYGGQDFDASVKSFPFVRIVGPVEAGSRVTYHNTGRIDVDVMSSVPILLDHSDEQNGMPALKVGANLTKPEGTPEMLKGFLERLVVALEMK